MNWTNVLWIAAGLFGSLAVGLIIGRIAASIKYPNPDKPQIFTPKQSLIILCAVLVAVGLIVFAVLYNPGSKDGAGDPYSDGEMYPDGGGDINNPGIGIMPGGDINNPGIGIMPAGGDGEDLDPDGLDGTDGDDTNPDGDGDPEGDVTDDPSTDDPAAATDNVKVNPAT